MTDQLSVAPTPTGPALSATSDRPDMPADAPPLSASGMAPDLAEDIGGDPAPVVETPAEAPEPVDPPADGEPPPAEPVEAGAKRRPDQGVGKKLNELEAANAAAERKAAEEKGRADELARQLDAERARKTEQPDPAPDAKPRVDVDPRPERPKRADFQTGESFDAEAYEAARDKYTDDLSDWSRREAKREVFNETEAKDLERTTRQEREAQEQKADETFQTKVTAHNERVAKVKETIPDFETVAFADDVPISPSMVTIIVDAENGPEIMYYLGQHKDEARKIFDMVRPGVVFPKGHPLEGQPVPDLQRQVFELGRIAARVGTNAVETPVPADVKPTQPRTVSKTPAPVEPVRSRSTATAKSAEDMSGDEYYNNHPSTKARLAAEARARGGAVH